MRNAERGTRNEHAGSVQNRRDSSRTLRNPQSTIRNGFTLIEIMVVIAIIVTLLGAFIVVGRTVIERGKEKETSALLQKLDMAAKEFESKKPLGKMRGYISRYENYAADELDGFSSNVMLPVPNASRSGYLSPSNAELMINNTQATDASIAGMKYGDIKAFALAVRLFSDTGGAILDEVASKYRKAAAKDNLGTITEYLDRNGNNTFDAGIDEPLDYFVDAWGTPVAYFAVHDSRVSDPYNPPPGCTGAADGPPGSPAAGDRLRASHRLVQLNNGVPLFVSYGADGPDQFSQDFFDPSRSLYEAKDLIYDYAMDDGTEKKKKFDNRFNQDNVYSHEGLKERIAAYVPPSP